MGTVSKEGVTSQGFIPCACMGPQGTDPVCPCAMRRQGLTPHSPWTPEKIAEFNKALGDIFGWKS